MPTFSKTSASRLATCDERLQKVFNEVIKYFDCTIIEGHRGEEDQNKAYNAGRSKVKFPNSKHNKNPSKAVDVIPYTIDWKDVQRMCFFAGFVMATAISMGIQLRWGGDWDGDTDLKDNTFDDLVHFELKE